MTDDDRLLMYLETRAVANRGVVNRQYMSEAMRRLAAEWDAAGYVAFRRLPDRVAARQPPGCDHHVVLSAAAWEAAAALRRRLGEAYAEDMRRHLSAFNGAPAAAEEGP